LVLRERVELVSLVIEPSVECAVIARVHELDELVEQEISFLVSVSIIDLCDQNPESFLSI
jgi:hypothetical protein